MGSNQRFGEKYWLNIQGKDGDRNTNLFISDFILLQFKF